MRHVGSLLGLALVLAVLSTVPQNATAAPSASNETFAGTRLSMADLQGSTPGAQRVRGFPTQRTAGVPPGWQPRRTVDGDVTVSTAGALLENVRIVGGDLIIAAPNVTVRRVEVLGGVINNYQGGCQTGLKVKQTTIRRAPGQSTSGDEPALGVGGYTARRVEILGLPEGFRVGGKDDCGGVKIINSYAKVKAPADCGDWHGDALQGYDGGALILRNSVLKLVEGDGCGGTAPFFYPADQGNTSVTVDGLLVSGGGFSFRLGTPGNVTGLHIEQGEFYYGPIDVRCSALSSWDADIAKVQNGQPVAMRSQGCNSNGGD